MGEIVNSDGKYSEDLKPFDESQIMKDDKFLLMEQCLRDARQLSIMMRYTSGDNVYLESWTLYQKAVRSIANKLFIARIKEPVTVPILKKIILAGESASDELDQLKFVNEEIVATFAKLKTLNIKIADQKKILQAMEDDITRSKARNFLYETIGKEKMKTLEEEGKFEFIGTNDAVYKISNSGLITKFHSKSSFFSSETKMMVDWAGSIKKGKLPLNDAIATVYMNILKDSDKFDEDKGCGNISIRN